MTADAPRPSYSLGTVCINCADAHEMARFYGEMLGWSVTLSEPDWVLMRDPHGGTGLSFQAEQDYVPPTWPAEDGSPQMQLHLDIAVDDLDAAVAHAVASGARLAGFQPQEQVRVLFDPAGHPFCLFAD